MSHNMFSYNQEEAVKAGVSNFVSESNAYAGKIVSAEWIVSSQKGTKGIELSFETDEGLRANYLTIYYQKSDNTMLTGSKMLNAIIGCVRGDALTSKGINQQNGETKYFCPELQGKVIGLILQKVLYTKQDGSDGYKFEIRIPFIPQTGKTLGEQLGNKDAQAVNKILSTLTDKDDRTGGSDPHLNQGQQSAGMDNFVDDGWE